ncbi:MAG: RING finger domain-containing protein [Candidatus Babeliales bacterium]|nr:RING finger domain-containing protein [Candidatus Babeliales bacterium]
MRNKSLILVCLMSALSLVASAPRTEQELRQELREAGLARTQGSQRGNAATATPIEEELEQEQEETCVICYEVLHTESKPIKTLDCQSRNPQALDHTFHTACIDEWLERDPRCPVCRTAVLPNAPVPHVPIDVQRGEQLRLGELYTYGNNGIARDFVQARTFLNQANQEDAPINVQRRAQTRLGDLYRLGGNGIVQDFAQARIFYNQANQVDAPVEVRGHAQLGLGDIYRVGGDGIDRDFAQARIFYNQANNDNLSMDMRSEAQLRLGDIYREGGNGIDRDSAQARIFYNQANNNPYAPIWVQRQAESRLGLRCVIQ